jgi:hypothetical protein
VNTNLLMDYLGLERLAEWMAAAGWMDWRDGRMEGGKGEEKNQKIQKMQKKSIKEEESKKGEESKNEGTHKSENMQSQLIGKNKKTETKQSFLITQNTRANKDTSGKSILQETETGAGIDVRFQFSKRPTATLHSTQTELQFQFNEWKMGLMHSVAMQKNPLTDSEVIPGTGSETGQLRQTNSDELDPGKLPSRIRGMMTMVSQKVSQQDIEKGTTVRGGDEKGDGKQSEKQAEKRSQKQFGGPLFSQEEAKRDRKIQNQENQIISEMQKGDENDDENVSTKKTVEVATKEASKLPSVTQLVDELTWHEGLHGHTARLQRGVSKQEELATMSWEDFKAQEYSKFGSVNRGSYEDEMRKVKKEEEIRKKAKEDIERKKEMKNAKGSGEKQMEEEKGDGINSVQIYGKLTNALEEMQIDSRQGDEKGPGGHNGGGKDQKVEKANESGEESNFEEKVNDSVTQIDHEEILLRLEPKKKITNYQKMLSLLTDEERRIVDRTRHIGVKSEWDDERFEQEDEVEQAGENSENLKENLNIEKNKKKNSVLSLVRAKSITHNVASTLSPGVCSHKQVRNSTPKLKKNSIDKNETIGTIGSD